MLGHGTFVCVNRIGMDVCPLPLHHEILVTEHSPC